jgi:thymidine kinase
VAKLYFYYSAMNAGKSTNLLQSKYNYEERGMQTIVLTPQLDDRYGVGSVKSRIGLETSAYAFKPTCNLFDYVQEQKKGLPQLKCVLIDEAQFLSKAQVYQLTDIVDTIKVPVLAYGLRTDFLAEIFEGSRYLLGLADELVELKTICFCGRKATMNMRIDSEGNAVYEGRQIEIGGNDRYVSTCRIHYKEAMLNAKLSSKALEEALP